MEVLEDEDSESCFSFFSPLKCFSYFSWSWLYKDVILFIQQSRINSVLGKQFYKQMYNHRTVAISWITALQLENTDILSAL